VTRERTYRCLTCLEHTLTREFDVSHLSVTCPACDSFERFVNDDVYQQFEAYEESPPESLDWSRLDRMEKLMVSERVVRTSRSIEDFDIEE
jgi:phage FluMu protein Com